MTDKRSMYVTFTVFISADMETDGEHTEITLKNVKENVMGALHQRDEVPETTPEWRQAMAQLASKSALQYLIDGMDGKHEEKPPEVTQKGADA